MIIENEPSAVYHAKPAPGIGSHALMDSDQEAGGSLRAYYELHVAPPIGTSKESDGFKFGRAFHARVGEARDFALGTDPEFVIRPPTYVNAKKETKPWSAKAKECEAWLAKETRTVLKPEDALDIERMRHAMQEDDAAREIMQQGKAEVVVRRTDEVTGLTVQCRFDWIDLDRKIWADFKTTDDLAWFTKDIVRYHYDRQHAWYSRILCDEMKWTYPDPDLRGYIIASSKELPWSSQVYTFTPERLTQSDSKNRLALNRLAQAYHENHWPHATGGIITV